MREPQEKDNSRVFSNMQINEQSNELSTMQEDTFNENYELVEERETAIYNFSIVNYYIFIASKYSKLCQTFTNKSLLQLHFSNHKNAKLEHFGCHQILDELKGKISYWQHILS